MDEEAVGDRGEPLGRVVVPICDRLVAGVAARQHQRAAGIGQQQVVQRRVGEHHAELGDPGRDGRGDARSRPARREHDRPRGPHSSSSSAAPSSTSRRAARRRGHQRERLVLARFARPQRGDGALVVGAAGEMEAADALDGDDPPAAQHRRAALGPRRRAWPRGRAKLHPRAAVGQAFGWAWKRRSAGSWYSAPQAAHIAKPAIVVSGRSYGTPRDDREARAAVVQLMNG